MNKKTILLTTLLILFLSPLIQADQIEEFNSPEDFAEYVYKNYSEENFAEVYNNFAAELKRTLEEQIYIDFQEQNFEKYKLEYTEIEVGQAEEIEFDEIKDKFNYAMDFGHYYKLQVSYLLKFTRLGRHDERSEKMVYIRKINDDFQIFWDYQSALDDDKAANRDDDNE